ncbi:MAG: preprotein translocase subunit SecE [Patescibacteria group bacterium]|nr:preprotein translocase subunit SecE [Patescibacteria group bacterium]
MLKTFLNYFKESWQELSKVVWPTRKQTLEMTVAVIVLVLAMGAFLGGIDFLLSRATSLLIGE